MLSKNYTPNLSFQKIKQYCAYQERCHFEVQEKLFGFGLNKNEVDIIICKLIDDNFLNEERYAIHFAGGKFRIKQWGRIKIKYELKKKRVSDYCIKKAIYNINEIDYMNTLQSLFQKKISLLNNEKNVFVKKSKLFKFLTEKGFEADLIKEIMNKSV